MGRSPEIKRIKPGTRPGLLKCELHFVDCAYAPLRNCSGSTGDEPLRISK